MRLFAKENGYLKFGTRLLESVAGGHVESGFWPSSIGLAGPGSLLLRPDTGPCAPTTFCNAAKLPIATAVFPMKLRRVNSLIIISPEGSEFVFWVEIVYVMRSRPDRGWQAEQALDRSTQIRFLPHDCVERRAHRSQSLNRGRKIGVACARKRVRQH